MKTRMELWADYRSEINNNARLKESVQFSNQKLNILRKRIISIIPDYDQKYKIELDEFRLDHKEVSETPNFSEDKILELLDAVNLDQDYASNMRAIDNLDFSSHELDDVLENIKKHKSIENSFFAVNRDNKSYVSDIKKVSIKNKEVKKPNIAIDGPSGSGKSTIAKKLARKFNLRYINTGLVYRAIAVHAMNNGLELDAEPEIIALMDKAKLALLDNDVVKLNNIDITKEVRSDDASQGASRVAAMKGVRTWAVALQQEYGNSNGVIMDGRDTTFKIMPNADVEWSGKVFTVIDTGGIEVADKPFQEQIKIQAQIAIEEANIILFMIDGNFGLTADDLFIANILRRSNKEVILIANKLEGNKELDYSIYEAGFETIFSISAIHGEGIGDALDEVINRLSFASDEDQAHDKITIIGRPNAGKSTLLNLLANEERSIVSPQKNTTRDSINSDIKILDEDFTIIDTAGINRKSKLVESVDHYALSRAKRSIEESDMVILLIDYERDLAHFDSVVGGYIDDFNKPTIIVVNKWDLPKKDNETMKQKTKDVMNRFKFMAWAPIEFISAKTGLRVDKLKELILEVNANRKKIIKVATLNDVMREIQLIQPAQSFNGGRLKVKFIKQVESYIPTFIIWVNNKDFLHFTYQRFLENKMREYFGFRGTPLRIVVRDSKGDRNEK